MQRISTIEELQDVAGTFVASLVPKTESATLVTLSGELGAGKTAFVKACAVALGSSTEVTSPTFVIENRYELPSGGAFSRLIHIDAYRLEDGAALAPLRFDEDLHDSTALIMLEWPERVRGFLPAPDIAIGMQLFSDDTRQIDMAHTLA